MRPKPKITLLWFQFFCIGTILAQTSYKSKFLVDTTMKDTFAFTKHWAYPEGIWKDESGFHNLTAEKIMPKDTIHIYFTADCKDKAWPEDSIGYCYATKKAGTIKLRFEGELPGYFVEHAVYIKGDSFYVKPSFSYEFSTKGEQMTYPIQQQLLTLNKKRYHLGDTIIGYMSCSFVENWSFPGYKTKKTKMFFKGYFCTPLKQEEGL